MDDKIINKLEALEKLNKYQLIIQLYNAGVTQGDIAKKLRIAKKEVNDLLKGIDKTRDKGK